MQAEPRTKPLIQMEGIGVKRSGRWLVADVDLTIAPGEIVTLVGPNGAGKSTVAKVATGVLKPSKGVVSHVDGLKIGYVPQKLTIDWTLPLTVERLMTLTGKYSSTDITAALDAVGAKYLRTASVQHLSGGEFQRVLLARAIVRHPNLLVLDEPVQGVDFSGEVALYDLIGHIRDTTGCGILMISHDLHVVMAGTDTVVCLNGHVCCRGTPDSVAKSPEYKQMFGARGADTLAIYHHRHDHSHLPDGGVAPTGAHKHSKHCGHEHAPDEGAR